MKKFQNRQKCRDFFKNLVKCTNAGYTLHSSNHLGEIISRLLSLCMIQYIWIHLIVSSNGIHLIRKYELKTTSRLNTGISTKLK